MINSSRGKAKQEQKFRISYKRIKLLQILEYLKIIPNRY